MSVPDYTTVIGVDAAHLRQFMLTWPTWARHKPSLRESPLVVFYDIASVQWWHVTNTIDHPNLTCVPWPPIGVDYPDDGTRWGRAQRYCMLAGFVHVPPQVVETRYWLKLDTDMVATGVDDWIDPAWFNGEPAIIAQRWHYTKPPTQMLDLDNWAAENRHMLPFRSEPLNLRPKSGDRLVRHERIISWCGFFRTDFTRACSEWARQTCGEGFMPVPSQDGYVWYCAKRNGELIRLMDVRERGWFHSDETVLRGHVEAVNRGEHPTKETR